eukprot:2583983-Amphidinium_carterae.1
MICARRLTYGKHAVRKFALCCRPYAVASLTAGEPVFLASPISSAASTASGTPQRRSLLQIQVDHRLVQGGRVLAGCSKLSMPAVRMGKVRTPLRRWTTWRTTFNPLAPASKGGLSLCSLNLAKILPGTHTATSMRAVLKGFKAHVGYLHVLGKPVHQDLTLANLLQAHDPRRLHFIGFQDHHFVAGTLTKRGCARLSEQCEQISVSASASEAVGFILLRRGAAGVCGSRQIDARPLSQASPHRAIRLLWLLAVLCEPALNDCLVLNITHFKLLGRYNLDGKASPPPTQTQAGGGKNPQLQSEGLCPSQNSRVTLIFHGSFAPFHHGHLSCTHDAVQLVKSKDLTVVSTIVACTTEQQLRCKLPSSPIVYTLADPSVRYHIIRAVIADAHCTDVEVASPAFRTGDAVSFHYFANTNSMHVHNIVG